MDNQKARCREIAVGDWVIATEDTDYKYLIGIVSAIDKLGAAEHITENDSDDIHVDFFAFDYPEESIQEIEQRFSSLYNEEINFDDLSLDDVVMAPDMLICITNLLLENAPYMSILHYNFGALVSTIR